MKKERMIVSCTFIISLIPMLLPQYGGCRGVQEISGIVNLLNPIGISAVIMFFVGVLFKKNIFGLIGCIGIVAAEIYKFLTWHIMTNSGHFNIGMSFRFAYPEFYIGLLISILMTGLYTYMFFIKKTGDIEKKSVY